MNSEGFKGLYVWQKGIELAVFIYQITQSGDFSKDYSLRNQIRDAAVSIPSNIAEGDELATDKQAIKHFYISKGSCAEVLTQAIIAQKIGYLNITEFRELEFRCTELSKMLAKLIAARSKS